MVIIRLQLNNGITKIINYIKVINICIEKHKFKTPVKELYIILFLTFK